MSELREEAAIAREALVTHRFHASASSCIGFTHLRAPPLGIYYTCMNYWMQMGSLRDLLHLHELVIGNVGVYFRRACRTGPNSS